MKKNIELTHTINQVIVTETALFVELNPIIAWGYLPNVFVDEYRLITGSANADFQNNIIPLWHKTKKQYKGFSEVTVDILDELYEIYMVAKKEKKDFYITIPNPLDVVEKKTYFGEESYLIEFDAGIYYFYLAYVLAGEMANVIDMEDKNVDLLFDVVPHWDSIQSEGDFSEMSIEIMDTLYSGYLMANLMNKRFGLLRP